MKGAHRNLAQKRARNPVRRGFIVLACGLVLEAPASAQPPPDAIIQLNWNAISSCPSREEVRAEVLRLLGSRASPAKEAIAVDATVTQENSSYLVRLEVKSPQTQGGAPAKVRELRGPSCKAVADASALIMAMMIDPSAAMDYPSDQNDPDSSPPPKQSPGSAPPPIAPAREPPPGENSIKLKDNSKKIKQAEPAIPKNTFPALHAFGWFALDTGSMPALAPGLGVALGVAFGPRRIELGLAAFPEASYRLVSHPSAGGRVHLIAGTLDVCSTFWGTVLQWGACAAAEIGRLHAEGFGVPRPGQADLFWIAGKGSTSLTWIPLGTTALSLKIEALVPLNRARFILENIDALYAPSAFAGRAYLGLTAPF